jgi:hypothetical protein
MEFTAEQKLYADIVQKAWEDANFKKALVENPVATIESFTGQKLNLPAGKTLVVRDQTDEQTVYINIPATPEVNVELNEEQLEAVAGGCQWGKHSGGVGFPWPPKGLDNPLGEFLTIQNQ